MRECTCGIETAKADALCTEPDCPWRSLPLGMLYREREREREVQAKEVEG